jgi:3-methylcrotonyl-CoA carboxylase alpha subunit
MGLKDAAKARMIAAGVPVTPGYLGEDQSPERLQAEADAIGYPVLIKAVAGGGGKGMRRVDAGADFAEALASCRREAASSFGDDRVLIEKYILSPRHIEVQVFGDAHGNVVHLFERDCSLQRRHQKVIEEAPAPGMDSATREAVCAAAVRAAKAVDYEGAGTIEFIADGSEGLRADRIWFMEMNTRLQVEHPVTEEITGVDLVEWQLRVASGEALPKRQDELSINGWAMEARLYAEDPAKGFLPSTGKLTYCNYSGMRIEASVYEGDEISPYYDPMIAKIITHSDTREETLIDLRHQCAATDLWPVKTNAGFLAQLLARPEFAAGAVDTTFIATYQDELVTIPPLSEDALDAAVHLLMDTRPVSAGALGMSGFRLNGTAKQNVTLLVDDQLVEVRIPADWSPDANYLSRATWQGRDLIKFDQGYAYRVSRHAPRGNGQAVAGNGAIISPMPGKVISVDVEAGQFVTKGQKLLVLEAMKMEHALTAPFDGVVAELNAVAGSQVQVDALLVKIEKAE